MNKPLVRWVIGPVSDNGFRSLRLAVRNMRLLYGSLFDYAICHNGLSDRQLSMLPSVDVIVNQEAFVNAMPIAPPTTGKGQPAWKLYPPRLRFDVHEIIMDNDVILHEKPKAFDNFLAEDTLLVVTEAYKRSYSGRLESLVPKNFNINSGVVCLPPKFDYGKELKSSLSGDWHNHFDEQTLVALVLSRQASIEIIPLSEVYVCFKEPRTKGSCGSHLVGLNSDHFKWSEYDLNLFL